jgi:transcriptional regulator with XRE-family HTH domain
VYIVIYYETEEGEVMQISNHLSEKAVLEELAQRLVRRRVALNLTQEEAAESSGMGKRTLERIESGEDFRVSSLIKLLKTLKMLEVLDELIPPDHISPIQLLDIKKGRKRRASTSRKFQTEEPWHWGDQK